MDPANVVKVPIGGGAAITLATGQHAPVGLAVDSANVYWANSGTLQNGGSDGQIMMVPK